LPFEPTPADAPFYAAVCRRCKNFRDAVEVRAASAADICMSTLTKKKFSGRSKIGCRRTNISLVVDSGRCRHVAGSTEK